MEKDGKIGDILLKNISKSPVLEDITLHLTVGKVYMIMGPSGSGKTTILNILAGLLEPDTGEYLYGGRMIAGVFPDRTKFRREILGYVFQDPELMEEYTVRENILSSISFFKKRFPNRAVWEKKAEILEHYLELEKVKNKRPGKISGGERQRVSIGRALLKDPFLLLCDEPTSALDYRMKEKVLDLLRNETKDRKRITIIVSHDWELLKYADQAFYLTQGRISEILYEEEGKISCNMPSESLHSVILHPDGNNRRNRKGV